MSLNETPSAERLHIGFFGMRNAGKSSLVNAVTGQELSLVSRIRGTTTDPVKKAMELLPLGPVVIIDTPGMDDEGELGEKRVERARRILAQTDIAVLVVDARIGMQAADSDLVQLFEERKIPYLIAMNKADLLDGAEQKPVGETGALTHPDGTGSTASCPESRLYVSALTGLHIHELKEKLGDFARLAKGSPRKLIADLLSPGELVVLVIPIDESAPKGRLILPQQAVMRDILDAGAVFAACQPRELPALLRSLSVKPALVVTDSQAFEEVSADTPDELLLTSFSILFARYKGSLPALTEGAKKLSRLKDGDRVLISEGCTHHRQCNDIGTVKMPSWIEQYAGASLRFSFTSGGEFPEDLSGCDLVVHCGGCMLNEKEMRSRMEKAARAGVPIVNYGIAIAQMKGILERSLQPFAGRP